MEIQNDELVRIKMEIEILQNKLKNACAAADRFYAALPKFDFEAKQKLSLELDQEQMSEIHSWINRGVYRSVQEFIQKAIHHQLRLNDLSEVPE